MFCPLKGATLNPRLLSDRQIAVVIQLLPTCEAVPTTISARPRSASSVSSRPNSEPNTDFFDIQMGDRRGRPVGIPPPKGEDRPVCGRRSRLLHEARISARTDRLGFLAYVSGVAAEVDYSGGSARDSRPLPRGRNVRVTIADCQAGCPDPPRARAEFSRESTHGLSNGLLLRQIV